MRAVESFELVLSGSLPEERSLDGVAVTPHQNNVVAASYSGLRLLLTFDAADRLHLPGAVVSAILDTRHRQFIILFEDSAHREEVAFPVAILDPNNNTPDPDGWANILKMVESFEHLVVVGLSSLPASGGSSGLPSDFITPAQNLVSPEIVVFGEVPLTISV